MRGGLDESGDSELGTGPGSCQPLQICSLSVVRVPTIPSDTRTIDELAVCFGCIQETLVISGEVVRCVCMQMESNYPTYLAPCPCHSSPPQNMSVKTRAGSFPPCLLPVVHRKGSERFCGISVLLRAACRAWWWPRKLRMICLKAPLGGGVRVI